MVSAMIFSLSTYAPPIFPGSIFYPAAGKPFFPAGRGVKKGY
jgi:hypothetical protein